MIRPFHFLGAFYKALIDTVHHDGIEHAGYMAFLNLLALFPFLVFLMALVGFIGQSEIGTQFVALLLSNLPEHVAHALEPRIKEIISGPPQGLMTIAIIGAIWTSSSAVEGLRTILNRIHRVNTPPHYIWRRLLSILQFIILTFLIIVVMSALIFMPIIANKLFTLLHINLQPNLMWNTTRYAVTVLVLFGGICGIYYVIPNASMRLWSVIPGAIVVMLGWVAVGAALSNYLAKFRQVNLIYGSLEGIIVSLLFFYIINIILIYGAELNYSLRHRK